MLPADVLERVGLHLDLGSRRACVLAHRDLVPVMRGHDGVRWVVGAGCCFAAKLRAVLRLQPGVRELGLTVDGSSAALTARQAAELAEVWRLRALRVVSVTKTEDGDARVLLSVLGCLREGCLLRPGCGTAAAASAAVLLLRKAERLSFADALRAIELSDRAEHVEVAVCHPLVGEDAARLERAAAAAARPVGRLVVHHATRAVGAATVRAVRAAAAKLVACGSAAFTELAAVADVVLLEHRVGAASSAELDRELLARLARNRALTRLYVGDVDMPAALLERPLAPALREGVTLVLHDRAAEDLALAGFLDALLAATRCNIELRVHSLMQRLVVTRALRHVARTDMSAQATRRVRVHNTAASEKDAETELAQPQHAQLRRLLLLLGLDL
jgi:hypothetical protein